MGASKPLLSPKTLWEKKEAEHEESYHGCGRVGDCEFEYYKAREQWVNKPRKKRHKKLTQSTRVKGGGSNTNSRAMGECKVS